ncbi:hypothetical protein SAMN05444169_3087 [Bradyrhizobium erythrophlei]|uniref:Uncharacterized protein n=1 Tax=Bradyrhizobium erythrophlei TaxID=1437360 RepID=A0A1M5KVC1_9BRAD|nr:hypothetical protein SAMN05444169_3087 [Bradyrhizobium erythrophlei]
MGVFQPAQCQNESENLLRHPPPPTPPHRFAGGGEKKNVLAHVRWIALAPATAWLPRDKALQGASHTV